jgi:topoisomerase-4 subunit B
MKDAQFLGQTKEKLTSRQTASFVTSVVKDALTLWLHKHVKDAELITEMVIANAQKRQRSRQKVVRKKLTSGPALPGKLTDCVSSDPRQCELFLVEGDSAGGSAKQARDKEYQAVMPLRGKILNTWEIDSQQILSSQEVHDISVAIGADSDGQHIATLLCALFMKHFRPLIEHGYIYVALPPLYRVDIGKEVHYALDDDEKQGILDSAASKTKQPKIVVQRFKGLGEMNPIQLRDTTMSIDTRRLLQLTVEDNNKASKTMDMMLAKKRAADRKKWLETKGNLADTV